MCASNRGFRAVPVSLTDTAATFLGACGFGIVERQPDVLIVKKTGDFDTEKVTCVCISAAAPDSAVEDRLLERFLDYDNYAAEKILLTESLAYSAQFRRDCSKDLKVRILSPARFFDTPFNYDNDKQASGVVKTLATDGEKWESTRVRQPFVVSDQYGRPSPLPDSSREDLAEHLLDRLREWARSPTPALWIVAAPAGYGKTRAFSSLFATVYAEFHAHKKRHKLFPRPFPMVAEHLRRSAGRNITGLIDAFLKTDFSRHTDAALFKWMVDNGHALWMFDGMDEVITGDRSFVPHLLEHYTTPDATPLMLISIRDSVLRSNEDLAELLEGSGDAVTVFKLEPWTRREKRQLVWSKIHRRLPHPELSDDWSITEAVAALSSTSDVETLTSTPFYADVLVDEEGVASELTTGNELDVLDFAVDRMCKREYEKGGPIQETVLPISGFREWLEEVAAEVVENAGIGTERLVELAELVMALVEGDGDDREENIALVEQIKAMPFLTLSDTSDRLEFVHELLGDYLAGLYYVRQAREEITRRSLRQRRAVQFGHHMGRSDLPNDSLRLRTMATIFGGDRDLFLRVLVESPVCGSGIALKNCVRILAQIDNGREIIDRARMSMDGKDLSGVSFGSLDLTGMSLVGSDLSFADLGMATVRNAKMEAARLRSTRLPVAKTGRLDGATFGEAHNFVSVLVGNKEIADYGAFQTWARGATSVSADVVRPCPAVRQLAHVFGKFVRPSGHPRRDQIDMRGLLRGRQEKDVKPYQRVVEEVLKWGYLEKRGRGRVGKLTGDKYPDVVHFMMDPRQMSTGLRQVVSAVCEMPACSHVVRG